MKVSLIVPTRNRPESCARLVQALFSESTVDRLASRLQVLLVDDGSDPHLRQRLVAAVSQSPGDVVHLVSRPVPGGPSAARNTGIARADGDIVAFLDDDCIPADNFLEETVRLHRTHPEALLISGHLRSLRDDSISRFWRHYYSHAFTGGEGELYRIHRISSGHFSIKRSLLERFNPLFDESLPSREDYDLYLRLDRAGIPVYKADSIRATIECRRTLGDLIRQRAWYGRGEERLRAKYGAALIERAQRGLYPRVPLSLAHIHVALYLDRRFRSLRDRVLRHG